MTLDGSTRKRKQEELATWQRNLATLQGQAALHGMTPPIDLLNEIETAQRNIKRVQAELDAGQEQSAEATAISLFELVLVLSRRLDDAHVLIAEINQKLRNLEHSLSRQAPPSRTATASRWTAYLILAVIYTGFVLKEIRDVILANFWASILIIVMAVILAGLLRLLSTLLQPGGSNND